MRLKKLTLPALAALILGLLTLSSCSKEQNLLTPIPADADAVGMIKVKTLLEESGYKFEGGKAVAPAGIEQARVLARMADVVSALDASGVCDPNEVAMAAEGRDWFYTMMVSDKAKFHELTAEIIDWSDSTGEYDCGTLYSFSVLLDDERVWFTTAGPDKSVEAVGKLIKAASDNSITAMTGVNEILRSGNIIDLAVSRDDISGHKKGVKGENPELQDSWVALQCDIKDNKLVINTQNIKADGTPEPVKGLQPVNPAVLSYIPGNFNIALGFGCTPELDWASYLVPLASAGGFGFQFNAMLAAATPYLQAIDGTVMFAAGPANSSAYEDLEPGNWQFILMARLPQQKINDIVGMLRTSLFSAGVSPRMEKDGVMVIPQYGMDFYVGNVDGYFAVSNLPFDPNRQNQLTPLFNGKEGALSIDLPAHTFADLPFGIKLNAQLTDNDTQAEIATTGTDEPILQTLLKALM
ncbi:MAG: hypothetical protein NC212_03635 [Staphylococcus sp.]|nr:hypothetical protein [Staphylococcus sp.]